MSAAPSRQKSANRATKTINRTIALTQQDPIERLKEFCKQGLYKYRFTWDIFANGTMCECVLYISKYGSKRIDIAKEARFVASTELTEVKRVVSAVLLDRLGLGDDSEFEIDIEDEPNPQTPLEEVHDFARKAMKMASNMVTTQLANLDVSPEVREQLSSVTSAISAVVPQDVKEKLSNVSSV